MRNAKTLGFAVGTEDVPRLDHLSAVFAGGNRSAFLRQALDVMERLESARSLFGLQAYGQQQLERSGRRIDDIPALVAEALADPDPTAVAEAKLIVASLPERRHLHRDSRPGPSDRDRSFATLFAHPD